MTEKEMRVKQFELDVKLQESKVREARIVMEEEYKAAQASLESEHAKLREGYERERIQLDKEKVDLEWAKSMKEKGFDS